jgi:hypothetical protein
MIWRKTNIPGGSYEISIDGEIRTTAVLGGNGRILVGPHDVPQFTGTNGRRYVSVRVQGRQIVKQTHRLLAEAFVPNPDGLPFVRVTDGNFGELHPDRLEWTRASAPRPKGENSKVAKLTEADVRDIRERIAAGESGVSIGERYGVHPSLISHIKNGSKWSYGTNTEK